MNVKYNSRNVPASIEYLRKLLILQMFSANYLMTIITFSTFLFNSNRVLELWRNNF